MIAWIGCLVSFAAYTSHIFTGDLQVKRIESVARDGESACHGASLFASWLFALSLRSPGRSCRKSHSSTSLPRHHSTNIHSINIHTTNIHITNTHTTGIHTTNTTQPASTTTCPPHPPSLSRIHPHFTALALKAYRTRSKTATCVTSE